MPLPCLFKHCPSLWRALSFTLKELFFLCRIACVKYDFTHCACCSAVATHAPVAFDKHEGKNAKLGTLKCSFFKGNYIWKPESAFLLFFLVLLLHSSSLAYCSVQYLTFFFHTLTLFSSVYLQSAVLSVLGAFTHFCFLVPHFLSLGEFWIRAAFWCQAATVLLHVNKTGWLEAQWERLWTLFSLFAIPFFFLLVVGSSTHRSHHTSIIIIIRAGEITFCWVSSLIQCRFICELKVLGYMQNTIHPLNNNNKSIWAYKLFGHISDKIVSKIHWKEKSSQQKQFLFNLR